MLLDELINYCDEQYQNHACEACTSKSKCAGACMNNCQLCLDDIHYHKNIIRTHYDCEKLLYYYVCRYTYKYCSEIIYALKKLDLSNYPFFHILSLGCGGAPDLMAFQYMNYPQKISYVGLDENVYWEDIHNYIGNHFSSGKVQFANIDVLDYFNEHTIEECNVIIIQYLISFFYSKKGIVGIREWFSKLANSIVKYKPADSPMLVIINDADSIKTGRDSFPCFVDEIKNAGLDIKNCLKLRFKAHNYYIDSSQHASNRNLFDINDSFQKEYCVALSCQSAQLILEVI